MYTISFSFFFYFVCCFLVCSFVVVGFFLAHICYNKIVFNEVVLKLIYSIFLNGLPNVAVTIPA